MKFYVLKKGTTKNDPYIWFVHQGKGNFNFIVNGENKALDLDRGDVKNKWLILWDFKRNKNQEWGLEFNNKVIYGSYHIVSIIGRSILYFFIIFYF